MPLRERDPYARAVSGLAWMALASVWFSLMTVCARLAAPYTSWALVASARAWVGVLVALAVARFAGHALRVRDHKIAWGRSLLGCGGMVMSFYAMGAEAIAVGDIATIRATVPILVAVLAAIFLHERPTRAVYVAVPLAFAGVVVLVQPNLEVSGHLAAITMLGACFSAVAMLFLRRLGPAESPEAIAIHFGVVAGALTSVIALVEGGVQQSEGLVLVLGCGVAGGLGQLCMTRAYARERAAAVSAMGYLAVVLTHVLAFAVLGEPLGPARAVGAVLVIGAGLVLAFGRRLERGPPVELGATGERAR